MNNNQTQPTNQNPNRFHLKTWQWLLVLGIVAAAALLLFVGNELLFLMFHRPVMLPPQNQVTITTNKTEYEKKEDVKVIVSNNLNIPLYIYDCDPLGLVKAEDNSHVRGGLDCLSNLTLGIKPQESKSLVQPLSHYSELKGKFKIKLFTYPSCDETIDNWQHKPHITCGKSKIFYSNEFTIK